MRNQEHAGSSYHTPSADEIAAFDEDLSGLPWGSLSMGHVFAKGHESASRSGSRRDDAGDAAFDSQYLAPTSAYGGAADYGSTSASGSWDGRDAPIDDHYYGSSPYYMDFEQGADDYNYSSHR